MSNPINIALGNGALGATLQTADGVCGMVLTGVSETDGYTAGTPILVTSMADVTAAGISNANNPFAWRQIQDFYTMAGTGAQLYLMLVPDTMTVDGMCDSTNANGAIALLNFANGAIKFAGVLTDDTVVTVGSITAGINPACYTGATKAAVLANIFFTAQNPLRIIIGASSFNNTYSSLTNMTSGTTNNRSFLLLGDYQSGKAANMGMLLGLIASLPVQRKISRVRNGALPISEAYVGTATVETAGANLAVISGKGFITFRTFANVNGYFFSPDVALTASTDDYVFLCRGRVIDKAQRIAYTMFVQVVDDEIPSVPGTGLIDPGFALSLSNTIEEAINQNMTALGNCTGCTCFIDPTQNVVESGTVNVNLAIDSEAYAGTINVTLGFGL